ncbi:MAG TPA: DegT/DnrJ/EryC1/StrS family aminotransferase [Anaerolineae bacterium]|nr:DegT/DnrJ/EryC1/StrS family aminotransferase [Anaerolineae bacterium]HOQ98133.1 DegT/DnrJ/EryC1/StrS family aminotransferase [Anaerolineae bacterium]HPL29077.1 DegT/DnrJ/EryC1/StrS family aminotransferase [Anaerolineae bacterium]
MSELALLGGRAAKSKRFPVWPQYDERERRALQEVLESRVWWRTPGTKTLKFEQEYAAYHQAKHGIAVTNGTAAIEVVMAALEIGWGDEVIVPDFTFVATASAVLFAGAMPVMVDIRPDTYCIDPDLVEAAITPRTRAIIAVHLGGHPADLDRLTAIAAKHNLALVEDSAHAHASEWCGRRIGTFGKAGTFSFQASKLMTAGEGGMIITNDDEVERRARSAHDCGRLPGEWFYAHFLYGSNYRLSEWQGAVLSAQLSRLDEQTALRGKNACLLDKLLGEIPGITPQALDPRCTRNGHYAYIFHYDKSAFAGVPTKRFIEALVAEGIPNQASYPPVHELAVFQSGEYRKRLGQEQAKQEHAFLKQDYPNTARGAWETVWIPQYALLGDEADMHEIAAAIKKIQQNAKDLL